MQAEFTRRSQRLKELERQKENFAEAKKHNGAEAEKSCEVESLEEGTNGGVEVLGKTETAQTQETNIAKPEDADQAPLTAKELEAVAQIAPKEENGASAQGELVRENGGKERERELSQYRDSKVNLSDSVGALNEGNAHDAVAKSGDAASLSQSLYEQVRHDENVRLKIIGEYLSSIGKTGAPLMAGGVGTLTTPPKKAKSISQAGDMALLYFKKPTEM